MPISIAAPTPRSAAATAATPPGLVLGGSLYLRPERDAGHQARLLERLLFRRRGAVRGRLVGALLRHQGRGITLGAGINAAYQINDWLSIGGGPFALYGKLERDVAINTLLEPGDGRLEFEDDDLGFGGMVGLMLEPWQGTRFGVTYISPVELDFKDNPNTSNLGPVLQALLETRGLFERKIDLGLTVPQQVMVSAYHRLNEQLAIMGNVVWQDWSEFGKPDISVANTGVDNFEADLSYDDTWGFALGAQYAIRGRLAVVARRRLRHIADVEQRAFSPRCRSTSSSASAPVVQYSFNERLTVGAAYQYLNGGNADLDVERGPLAGRLEGDYQSNDFHFLRFEPELAPLGAAATQEDRQCSSPPSCP